MQFKHAMKTGYS